MSYLDLHLRCYLPRDGVDSRCDGLALHPLLCHRQTTLLLCLAPWRRTEAVAVAWEQEGMLWGPLRLVTTAPRPHPALTSWSIVTMQVTEVGRLLAVLHRLGTWASEGIQTPLTAAWSGPPLSPEAWEAALMDCLPVGEEA